MKYWFLLVVVLVAGCERPNTPEALPANGPALGTVGEAQAGKIEPKDGYDLMGYRMANPPTKASAVSTGVCTIQTSGGILPFLPRNDGSCHPEDAGKSFKDLQLHIRTLSAENERLMAENQRFRLMRPAIANGNGSIANSGTVGSVTIVGGQLVPDITSVVQSEVH